MKKEVMKFTESAVELFKEVYDISGGGVTPVDKLPEKGNVGTLYKTPDGNIYSWFHEETQKEVEVPPTLEVGKTYELKEQISISTFVDSINDALQDPDVISSEKSISGDIVNDELSFIMEFSINSEGGLILSTYEVLFSHQVEGTDQIRYYYSDTDEREDDYVHRQSKTWTGPTEITVTQEWIDNLNEDWGKPFDINNLNFLFVGTTETVTVVNEGYTQLNGIIIHENNIINDTIFLDDKNYNAKLIYDTLLRGGSALLKHQEREDEGEDEFNLHHLKSAYFGSREYGAPSAFIHFENQDVTVILKNQFDPVSTIKGQELIGLIQAYGPMEINNASLIDYINSTLSFEEITKELYRGIAISLFEGLVEYNVFYTLPMDELAPSTVTQITNFASTSSTATVLQASEGQQLYLEFLAQNIGDAYTPNDVVNNIITDKDYNCDIVVKFSDGTTKTIPMDKSVLYGNGFETSPLFRIHYLN